MNSIVFNGREIAVDSLSPQQRMLLEAVVEAENRVRTSERAAFLDRMAHEGARNLFTQTLAETEAADVQAP